MTKVQPLRTPEESVRKVKVEFVSSTSVWKFPSPLESIDQSTSHSKLRTPPSGSIEDDASRVTIDPVLTAVGPEIAAVGKALT